MVVTYNFRLPPLPSLVEVDVESVSSDTKASETANYSDAQSAWCLPSLSQVICYIT